MAFDFGRWLFGGGSKGLKKRKKTSGQMNFLQNLMSGQGNVQSNPLYQGGSDFMQKLYGGDFSAFEQPLMDKFEQEIVPGIAEQFAGAGAGSSSAFNQSMAQASKNLGSQLGAQRSQLMTQLLPQGLAYSQQPIANMLAALGVDPYEMGWEEGDWGLFGELMSSFASGMGGGR